MRGLLCEFGSVAGCILDNKAANVQDKGKLIFHTSMIFSMDEGSINGDVSRFSTVSTTPSLVWIPIAVLPNCPSQEYAKKKKKNSREKKRENECWNIATSDREE
jgi:hypothetical protein